MLFTEIRTLENITALSKAELRRAEHRCGIELLYELLWKHFKIKEPVIKKSEGGKPYIDENGVFFNISHSNGVIACVVSDNEVGIDIELIDSKQKNEFLTIAERFFTPSEIDFVREAENVNEAFYRVWTRKEAFAKLNDIPLSKVFSHDTMLDNTSTEIRDGYVISIARH